MFRLTIREFLLITALFGVIVAWWLDRERVRAKYELEVTRVTEERDGLDAMIRAMNVKRGLPP